MVIYKTFNDIVISMIEYLRLVQPELDTKPGTVSRDVFVDAPSQQIADLYSQLRTIAGLQSLFASFGTDLNKLASNYGATRGGGSRAVGNAVFTTNNMDVDILIPQGSIVTSRSGINFETLSSVTMNAASANVYRATATRLRSDLELASITDEFAHEITVQSLTSGLSGNIGRFYLTTHNISGVSNVTNVSSFSGGVDAESDDEFRSRILSIFAGSNTGTSLGYTTALAAVSGVLDSSIVVPGDPLMTRDGTQIVTNSSGELVVSSPGTGGKVDIYVLGTDLLNEIDSFIYSDQSGNNDPVDPTNDVILGQDGRDTSVNITQRRVDLLASGSLPSQPIYSIVSVAGSSSGANFVEKYTDENGEIKGNYELIKDTGDYGGSPFGFDRLHWVSNSIELTSESITKGVFNGSDELDFSDVTDITGVNQEYTVTNENSTKSSSSRDTIYLLNTPISTVSRVINSTTGERYVVENQNPDGTSGALNETGRITISGSTLPISTDVLQVDYTWNKPFDRNVDFDNLVDFNQNRTAQDSIDWGFSNLVTNEEAIVSEDAYGNLTISVSHQISRIISVNTFNNESTTVSNGAITASSQVSSIIDLIRDSDSTELFNTDARNGSISGTISVVLPSDTLAQDGDVATLRYNPSDVYTDAASFDGYVISLESGVTSGGVSVLVNYVADVLTLLPEIELTSLPALGLNNKFYVGGETTGEQPTSNLFDSNSNVIQNLRKGASHIGITVGSIPSSGTIGVYGTTFNKVSDASVVVITGTGYKVDLRSAILSDLGTSSVPSGVKLARITKVERIVSSGLTISVDNIYDIVNYKIYDNSYDITNGLSDSSLTGTEFLLPETTNNTEALLETGDILRVTFYYVNESDFQQVYFSREGTHVTSKVFSNISKISIGFGFRDTNNILSGTITVSNFNQPSGNVSYLADYNYTAPKENERITVTFEHNVLITTATNSIDDVRPITADVLVKSAVEKTVDVNIRIVILPEYIEQSQTVVQDAIDAVTSFLNSSTLGTIVDASDIVNVLYSVSGIDRVRIVTFSHNNEGNVLSISSQNNEYLNAGTVTITVEER